MFIELLWATGSFENCKLIVFDKDGTIVKFDSVWLNMAAARAQWLAEQLSKNSSELFTWRSRLLRAAGVNPETGDISLNGPIVNLSFENQSYCLASVLHALIPEKYSWEQSLSLTNKSIEWALHQNDPASLAEPIDGAFEFIKQIKKEVPEIKLALVTSDSTDNAERTLARFGVLDLFSSVEGSDIIPAKPSPKPLERVCKKLNIQLSETIVIGDAPNDIRMSLEAGVKVLCLEGLATKNELEALGASSFTNWQELKFKVKPKDQKIKNNSKNLILRTDGASRGNPGPAAIGFVIYEKENNKENIVFKSGEVIGNKTNNYAEYMALLKGLEKIISFMPNNLIIEMDSELIVKQIKREYKVKNPDLLVLFNKVNDFLKQIENYKIQHIRREKNKDADALCNLALDATLE